MAGLRFQWVVTLVLGVVLMTAFSSFGSVRAPAVAGAFYPGDEEALRSMVDRLLARTGVSGSPARAVIVPHAGYVYSGATAAQAFRRLEGSDATRVILIGPSHQASFRGGALPSSRITAFRTPLGDVEIDREVIEELRSSAVFRGPSSAHDGEHCLEVEIPFLQIVLPEARIVPILIGHHSGPAEIEGIAKALAEFLGPETVVVVSTDFSHHGDAYRWAPFAGDPKIGERLLDLARVTAELAAAGSANGFRRQVEVSGDTVCGSKPVEVLLEMVSHAFDGEGRVLEVTTSGQMTGDFKQSVSYASIAFSGRWEEWKDRATPTDLPNLSVGQQEAVVGLARAVLETHLGHGPELARWFLAHGDDPVLKAPAGAFVTLNHPEIRPGQAGRLRACMGVIEARQSVVDAVVHAAVSASTDPRFPALEFRELQDIEVEVSLLSPSHPVAGPEDIRIGVHGVLLSKKGHRAVFLPQVAPEQGWDRETMLDHLARKAGLAANAWRRDAVFEVFTAQVFGED
jgi:AmmeMemoRadiSam system protein B/AmmeMemoRadiSam system protein A